MKKILAGLLVLFLVAGNFNCLVSHAQETTDWSDISSVTLEAGDNEYYECTNGYFSEREVSENSWEEFFYYYSPDFEVTVNYTNGDFDVFASEDLDSTDFYEKFGDDSWSCDDGNQWEEPWGVGEHAFNLTICGYELQLPVTIMERPFESFQAVPSYASVKENTKGYISTRWDEDTDDYVEFWRYSEPDLQFVLTYADGTEETLDDWDVYDRFGGSSNSNMWDLQSDKPFEPGEHEITVSLMGLSDSYTFTVESFKPTNVEITPKNNIYTQYTNGWDDERYNEETEEYESFWYYALPGFDVEISFEDGTEKTYDRWEYEEEFGSISYDSDQYDLPWDIGEHYFTLTIQNTEYQLPVIVTETNIANVEVFTETTEYIKNTNGYESDDEWYYDTPKLKFKITYRDGTSVTTSNLYDYDMDYDVRKEISPEGDACIFTISIAGKYKTVLRVNLVESPVSSIEVIKLERVCEYETVNNEKYYSTNPVSGKIKIHYKDGTNKVAILNPVAKEYSWNGEFAEYSYRGYPIQVAVEDDLKAEIEYLGAKTEYQLSATGDDAFAYFEQDGKAFIYSYLGATTDNQTLTVPKTLGGFPVVAVTDMVYNGSHLANITELVLPNSVISISDAALGSLNNLTTLKLGSGIKYIDKESFRYNDSLENVYIKNKYYKDIDGVVYTADGKKLVNYPRGREDVYTLPSGVVDFDALPEHVEYEVTDDNSLKVVDGVTYTADMKAVVSCDSEKSGEYIMPDSVTLIYKRAFTDCDQLESIKISKNVTEIAYGAFNDCSSLKAIDLPVGLKKINSNAFYGADSLEKVTIHDIAAWCNVDIGYGGPVEMAGNIYLDEELITDLVIPEGVTKIGSNVFSGARCIETLSLPASLKVIDNSAFSGTELDKLIISDIAKWCEIQFAYNPLWNAKEFYLNNELIVDLVIPEGVTSIATDAFTYLPEHVKTLSIPSTIKSIGRSFCFESSMFDKIYLTDLAAWCHMDSLADNPLSITKELYINNESVTDLVIPEGVTHIVERAFVSCEVIKSVSFPSTMKKIGTYAFHRSGIEEYSFADGVGKVEYGHSVFAGTPLKNANLGSETTKISMYMFENSRIQSADIPATVTEIAYSAFGDCEDLSEISAPETLISIKAHAFRGTQWYKDKEDGSVYLGNNYYRYKGTAQENTIVEIKEGTLSIAECAFENVESIAGVILPNSIQLIENFAFNNTGIREITIPASLKELGSFVFVNCDKLKNIHVDSGNKYYSSLDGILYNKDMTELILCPEGKTGKIVIPESVQKIRSYAFNNVGNITLEIANPNIVLEEAAIGYRALYDFMGYETPKAKWIGNNDIELIAHEDSTLHQYAEKNRLNYTLSKHVHKTTTKKATTTADGSVVAKCTVCGKQTSKKTIYKASSIKLSTTSYEYNGKTKMPSVVVKNSKGTTLKKNVDYTVKYASGRKNVGKYKVTVTLKGNYTGTKTLSFSVTPPETKIPKLSSAKKAIKVTLTKKSSQVSGYEIQYSTSKKFKRAKIKTLSSYKTTKVTLSRLSAKKTYYVRVRTYKKVGGVKYYSDWSTYKSIKTK